MPGVIDNTFSLNRWHNATDGRVRTPLAGCSHEHRGVICRSSTSQGGNFYAIVLDTLLLFILPEDLREKPRQFGLPGSWWSCQDHVPIQKRIIDPSGSFRLFS